MASDDVIETGYRCPLCGRKIGRDLALFLDHTNQHVIDKIKISHPEWVAADGICVPCMDYYKKALAGDPSIANIGPKERKKRTQKAFFLFAVALGLVFYFNQIHASAALRSLLFLPLFTGIFCALQAKEKTCAILAQAGTQNMDGGEEKISDPETAEILRLRGQKIWKYSFLLALATTVFYLFFSKVF